MRPTPRLLLPGPALALVACSGGGGESTPLAGADTPPDLIACRSREDDPFRFSEIALRSERNLGTRRVGDRSGIERRVRLHPDGNTVVFARERDSGDGDSRELFVSTLDGSRAELRLTQNTELDDEPCWSPDGARVLFTSSRDGRTGLWLVAANGASPTPFVAPPAAGADGEADWHGPTDRVVWSRRDGAGRHTLWLANGSGNGAFPLTDGGATIGAGTGDQTPAFAPDGSAVVFVRRIAPELASLHTIEIASGTSTMLVPPSGDVALPRIAPTQDRVFFGLAEPDAGRATLRLAWVPRSGGTPTLVWPDERWRLVGLDLLPSLPTITPFGTPVVLDVERAEVQIATATSVFGVRSQLAAVDGDEFTVTSKTFDRREIAGINCRFDLPVADGKDVAEIRVRLVARLSRVDGDAVLRSSIYNPLDERFDTVVESQPADTTAQTLEFRTSSLRHITEEKQLRITVIADLPPGPRAELRIDLVEVIVVPNGGT